MSEAFGLMLKLRFPSSIKTGIPLTIITTSSNWSSSTFGNSYMKLEPTNSFRDQGGYSKYGGVLVTLSCPTIVIDIIS